MLHFYFLSKIVLNTPLSIKLANIFLNIIISYLDISEKSFYNELANTFIDYNEIFGKLKIFQKNLYDDLVIKDCLIDVNIIYRLFYEYDIERKKQRGFPIDVSKTLIYVGDAHRKIIMNYLTNDKGILVYKRNDLEFTNSFVNQLATIRNSYKEDKKFLLPSIYENFSS